MKITVTRNDASGKEVYTVGREEGLAQTRPSRIAPNIASSWMPYTQPTKAANAVKAAIRMIQVHHASSVCISSITIHSGDKLN